MASCNYGRVSLQRYVVPEGVIYLGRGCRSGEFEVWTRSSGYGDLIFQFGFTPDEDNYDSAWEIAIGNYNNGNMMWQSDEDFF